MVAYGQNTLVKHHPCSFEVSLPESFVLKNTDEDMNLDFCDAIIMLTTGDTIGGIASINTARIDNCYGIKDCFELAIKNSPLTISYQKLSDTWFVISGTQGDGDIVYLKRSIGENFTSELRFNYPPSMKNLIEPFLGEIVTSFASD